MRRDDETRWRPVRQSLSSRRRPPANHSDGPHKEERLDWMHQRPAKMSRASAPEARLVPAGAGPAVGLVRYGFEAGGLQTLAEQVEKRVASVYDR